MKWRRLKRAENVLRMGSQEIGIHFSRKAWRKPLGRANVDGTTILKWCEEMGLWTVFTYSRMGANRRLLSSRWRTSGFHVCRGTSWPVGTFSRMTARHPFAYHCSRLSLFLTKVTNLDAGRDACLQSLYAFMYCFCPNLSIGQYSCHQFKRVHFQISTQKAASLRKFSWYSSISPNSCRVRNSYQPKTASFQIPSDPLLSNHSN